MKRIRVLLADDHKIVAEGLRSILEPEFELVGTVTDGRALIDATQELRPDVIVVDISMPLLNGIEAVSRIKKKAIKTKVIFLTMHSEVTYAARAMDAGASGYILKHAAPSELITAIRAAMQGKIFITPTIDEKLSQACKTRKAPILKLSPRQREVLQLLAEGHSAKIVANILQVSPRTVEFHKYRMMEQLNLPTSAELVRYAIKQGIVST